LNLTVHIYAQTVAGELKLIKKDFIWNSIDISNKVQSLYNLCEKNNYNYTKNYNEFAEKEWINTDKIKFILDKELYDNLLLKNKLIESLGL
jgi:hypothetical protein